MTTGRGRKLHQIRSVRMEKKRHAGATYLHITIRSGDRTTVAIVPIDGKKKHLNNYRVSDGWWRFQLREHSEAKDKGPE